MVISDLIIESGRNLKLQTCEYTCGSYCPYFRQKQDSFRIQAQFVWCMQAHMRKDSVCLMLQGTRQIRDTAYA